MINRELISDDSGVAAIEYVVLIALIAIGLVAVLTSLGTETSNTYSQVGSSMGGTEEAAAPEPEPEATPPPRVPTRPGGSNRVPRG